MRPHPYNRLAQIHHKCHLHQHRSGSFQHNRIPPQDHCHRNHKHHPQFLHHRKYHIHPKPGMNHHLAMPQHRSYRLFRPYTPLVVRDIKDMGNPSHRSSYCHLCSSRRHTSNSPLPYKPKNPYTPNPDPSRLHLCLRMFQLL